MSNAAATYDKLLISCIKLGNLMSKWIIRGNTSKPPKGADDHEVLQLLVMLDSLRSAGVFSGFRITRGLYNGQLDAAVDRYLRDDNDFEEALFDRDVDSNTTYETEWGEQPLKHAGGPMEAFVGAFFTLYKRDFKARVNKEVVINAYDLSKQKLVPDQTEFDQVALQLFEELFQGINLMQRPPAVLQYGIDMMRVWGVLLKECLTSQRISLLQQRPLFEPVWDGLFKTKKASDSQQRTFFRDVLVFKSENAKLNRFYGWPSGQTFSNLDFSYATFQAHLSGCRFNNCTLDEIKLSVPPLSGSTSGSLDGKREARILNCEFSECSLMNISLSPLYWEENLYSTPGGSVRKSSFEGCSIGLWGRAVNMVEADFIRCDFPEEGRGMELEHSRLDLCSFIDCQLSKMALHKCGVVDSTFSLVGIHSLRLTDSTLVQCTFENVTFSAHIFFLQPERSYLINSLWNGAPATPESVNESSEVDLLSDIDGKLEAPFKIINNIIAESDEIGAVEDSEREIGSFAVPVLFKDVHKVYKASKEKAVEVILDLALTRPFRGDGLSKGEMMAHPDTSLMGNWSVSDSNIMARSLWFWLEEDQSAPGARAVIDSESFYQNTLAMAIKTLHESVYYSEENKVYTVQMDEGKDLLVGYYSGYDEDVIKHLIFGDSYADSWSIGPHEDESSLIYNEEDLVALYECDSEDAQEMVEGVLYGRPSYSYKEILAECWSLDSDSAEFKERSRELDQTIKTMEEQAQQDVEDAKEEVEITNANEVLSDIARRVDSDGTPLYHLLEVSDDFDHHGERFYLLNPKAFYIVDVQ